MQAALRILKMVESIILLGANLKVFSYAQLFAATNNFASNMVVGRGGFGKVYKGWQKEKVPSMGIKKSAIAVKRLGGASRHGFREWRAEVNILGGRLSHPNLVKLLGCSYENKELLLVYEFVQHGTLNYHLFGKGSVWPLPWDTRFKIIKGVAQGLAYLHSPEGMVIHRDLKSSNILLDKFYNAKIADFGLAALLPSVDDDADSRDIVGTHGYAAPEVIFAGHCHAKSDVYSFGVVLLEMLTGLRALDKRRPSEQQFLGSWVIPFLSNKRKLKNIMDTRLEGKYPLKEALLIAQLAIRCLRVQLKFRPSMKEIAETLEQAEASKCRSIRA